jgi:glutamine synthetase type III
MQKKIKSFQLVFLTVLCLVVSFAATNSYALDCGVAAVTRIGTMVRSPEKVAVFLQNKTSASVGDWVKDETQMFLLHADITNQALAVLLTAFTMNKTVYVTVASPATPGSIISGVHMNK